jgi:hypothetical protein
MSVSLFLQFDLESEHWEIMCESHGLSPMPAGPRLFKAPPHPDIEFRHLEKSGAEKALSLLEKYLAALPKKGPTKKQEREYVA